MTRARVLVAAVWLATSLPGCSGPAAPAVAPDPFSTVAHQADDAYMQGVALYEQGHPREALNAFKRARLLSPIDDPRIDDMIQRVSVDLTPTPTVAPATATPQPQPIAALASTATPGAERLTVQTPIGVAGLASAVPTPQLTAIPAAAAAPPLAAVPPPAAVSPPTSVAAPTPALPSAPAAPERPPVAATDVPAPTPTAVVTTTATTMFVTGGPAALDFVDALDELFIADGSGLVWSLQHGQAALTRPFSVPGDPVGLAADPASQRLYIAARSESSVVVLEATTGKQVASSALPSAPGDIRLDPWLARLYVVLPARDALQVIDTHDLKTIRITPDLSHVTGVALDPGTHTLYLSHLDGHISVLDGKTGQLTRSLAVSGPGLAGLPTADGRVIAINGPGKVVLQIDMSSGEISRAPLA